MSGVITGLCLSLSMYLRLEQFGYYFSIVQTLIGLCKNAKRLSFFMQLYQVTFILVFYHNSVFVHWTQLWTHFSHDKNYMSWYYISFLGVFVLLGISLHPSILVVSIGVFKVEVVYFGPHTFTIVNIKWRPAATNSV